MMATQPKKLKLNQYQIGFLVEGMLILHKDLLHPRVRHVYDWGRVPGNMFVAYNRYGDQIGGQFRCPYGNPGDRFWIAERWMVGKCDWFWEGGTGWQFRYGPMISKLERMCATFDEKLYRHSVRDRTWMKARSMPRWASRMTAEMKEVDLVQAGDTWLWKIKLGRVE